MKQFLSLSVVLMLCSVFASSDIQAQINAGPDDTICPPQTVTLTATVPPSQTGTTVSLTDDQYTGVINLGFSFTYFGNTYTQCLISSNNYITFNTGTPGGWSPWSINAALPSNANPTNSIMCPWQDLLPPSGGTITYATIGTAPNRIFVVAFCSVAMFSCTNLNFTSQIKLFEGTNRIETHIANKPLCTSWNSGRAIHGIQNNAGTIAFVVPGRNFPTQWTCTNDGYQWTPAGPAAYTHGAIPYSPVILAATLNPVQWYVGSTLIGTGNSINVSPTVTTTYTASVTGGCVGASTDQVTIYIGTASVSAGPPVSICNGTSTTLNATSPNTITTWAWTPGNTLSSTNVPNPTATPTVTTTYVVTATSSLGCTATSSVVVTVTQMTTASAGADDSICTGACTTLNASGGVSYLWQADPTLTGPLNSASITACPLATTTYHVEVTDANGCIGNDSVTIFVAPVPLSVNLLLTDVSCANYCNGIATATGIGGYFPHTYAWSTSSTGPNTTGLCSGTYTCTVTDNIGCTVSTTFSITEPTPLVVQSTNITTANCGQSDGSVTISVSGGEPGYSVLWPSGNTGMTENNLPPGQICVTVTDNNGCDTTVCFNVPNTAGVAATLVSSTNVTCFNACDGSATASGAGGTQPYVYSWNTNPAQNTLTATNLCAGTYTFSITDDNGCSDSVSVTITEPPLLTVAAGTASTICITQSATLSAQGNGGTPGYTYQWTDGVNIFPVQNPTVSPTITTTYTCVATDANGCISAPQTVTITVNPPLQVNAMATAVVCQNTVLNLTAAGTGGNGNLTYTWMPGSTIGASISITATTTQTYTVIVSDNCGTPVAQDTVSVIINPAPVPTFTALSPTQGCEDLCVQFMNTTPNTASVLWTFGNNIGTSTSSPATFCFNDPGQYDVSLTITDIIGCSATTVMPNYVDVYPKPVAAFSASPQPATLLNNQVQFTDLSTGGVNDWIWSFGLADSASFVQHPMYAFQDTGYFPVQLIVTNNYGCQDSITIAVQVQEDFAVFIPNTFTPNGDGLNDVFIPQGIGVDPDNYAMYIFDRWGNMIYTTTAWPGGWDGTVQGSSTLCQVDTYVYKITTLDPSGARRVYIGHLNLMK